MSSEEAPPLLESDGCARDRRGPGLRAEATPPGLPREDCSMRLARGLEAVELLDGSLEEGRFRADTGEGGRGAPEGRRWSRPRATSGCGAESESAGVTSASSASEPRGVREDGLRLDLTRGPGDMGEAGASPSFGRLDRLKGEGPRRDDSVDRFDGAANALEFDKISTLLLPSWLP